MLLIWVHVAKVEFTRLYIGVEMTFVNEPISSGNKPYSRTYDPERGIELRTMKREHISTNAWVQEFLWQGFVVNLITRYDTVKDEAKPEGIIDFSDCVITHIAIPLELSGQKEKVLELLFETLRATGNELNWGTEKSMIRNIEFGKTKLFM